MPTDQEMTFIKYKTLNVMFFEEKKVHLKKKQGKMEINQWRAKTPLMEEEVSRTLLTTVGKGL